MGENSAITSKNYLSLYETKAKISASITGRHQSEETKAKLSALQTTKHAVICIETKIIYDSVEAAARSHKIIRSNLLLACREHQRTTAGFHWCFLEDFDETKEYEIPPAKSNPRPRAVICLETKEIFPTIRQVAKWLGIVHGAVSRACRKHYAAGGYHFRYLEEYQSSQS